ncbi:unnamed protein product [Ectocarpus sp. CCAP 1310/34]|nr:unnamed protein product [Ectocarpus sp. CCAP 1310/34]
MTSDVPYNLMGVCGGLIVACAYAPQLARVIRRKQSADISYTHLMVFMGGMVMFLVYYGYYELWELFFPSLISMSFVILLLAAKIRMEEFPLRPRAAAAGASVAVGDTPGDGERMTNTSSDAQPLMSSW